MLNVVATEGRAYATSVELVSDGAPPKRVQLLPMGEFRTRDGRGPFRLVDQAHAEAVIAASRAYAGRQDLMVDYDHQSVFGVKDGVAKTAPASGWIKPGTMTLEADGIWAEVEWTAAAAARLEAKEYRYLSPYFGHDKATGRVTRIFNAALTNIPAIEELAAVASSDLAAEGSTMLKTIAKLLGLAEDADEATVTAAITTLQGRTAAAMSALGLAADATGEQAVAAAAALKTAGDPDPAKFVPIAVVTDLQAQLAAAQTGGAEAKVTAAVDAAVAAGKVTPAMKGWATDYAKRDFAGFEAFVAAAAAIVTPGKQAADDKSGATAPVLTDEQKAACAALGVSEDDYAKTLKKEQA